jgi:CO dehydrogenase/acetyl-CoA synthase delta subunit
MTTQDESVIADVADTDRDALSSVEAVMRHAMLEKAIKTPKHSAKSWAKVLKAKTRKKNKKAQRKNNR